MNSLENLESWQEAFESHKIPAVRNLEEQLRAGVVRDKEKLRDLVGGNYRDLLATADQIVLLTTKTKAAEGQISDIGQKCEPSQQYVQRRVLPLPTSLTAQVQTLSKCILCGISALRKDFILLSAKLTVVARLLIKSLAEFDETPQVVQQLRDKAASLRRQLLRRIDQELKRPHVITKPLVDAICAYCLITSASSSDAIKHFQQLRLDRLKRRFSDEAHRDHQLKETFQYLVATIQSLQTLLGRAVHDLLSNLQQYAILEDPSITQLEPIGVDQVRRLIPADISSFTPYIKRGIVSKDEMQSIVKAWTAEACQIFSKGLAESFSALKTVTEVLSVRKDLLNILLPVYFSTYTQYTLLEAIRQATATRILGLHQRQVKTLLRLSHDMTATDTTQASSPSVWESTFVQDGGRVQNALFIRQLHERHLGTAGNLNKNLRKLRSWARASSQLQSYIEALRAIRWQDAMEEADEGDEDDAIKILAELCKDDPQQLNESVGQSLEIAIGEYEKTIQEAVSNTLAAESVDVNRVAYLVRLVRESAAVVNELVPEAGSQNSDLLVKLHEHLISELLRRLSLRYETATSSDSTPSFLPEGLPSPLTISVLRDVCTIMSEMGGIDVWSQSAVTALKRALWETIWNNDHRAAYMQTDFDEAYLQAALKTPKMMTQSNESTSKTGNAATAYWNRTRLLFGILN